MKSKIVDFEKGLSAGYVANDQEVTNIVSSLVKRYGQSIDAYTAGNRNDLVEAETAELMVIKEFLPKQLTVEEIKNILCIAELELGLNIAGTPENKRTGMLMGYMSKNYKGQFDPKDISKLLSNV